MRRCAAIVVATAVALAGLTGCSGSDETAKPVAFCAAASSAPSLDSVIYKFTQQRPDDLQRNLDRTHKSYQTLRDNAPKEIEAEVEQVTAMVDLILTAISDNPQDSEAASNEVEKALKRYPGISQASKKVVFYVEKHCQLNLNEGMSSQVGTGQI